MCRFSIFLSATLIASIHPVHTQAKEAIFCKSGEIVSVTTEATGQITLANEKPKKSIAEYSKLIQASAKNREKDAFETTEDFKLRISNQKTNGWLDLNEQQAFCFETTFEKYFFDLIGHGDDSGKLRISYDADKKIIQIVIHGGIHSSVYDYSSSISDFATFLQIGKLKTTQHSYIGSNGFNIRRNVTQINEFGYALGFLHKSLKKSGLKESVVNLKIEPNEAKKIINKIGVIYLTKPISPYVFDHKINKDPTIDNPLEINKTLRVAYGELNEVIVFDQSNREILLRIQAEANK